MALPFLRSTYDHRVDCRGGYKLFNWKWLKKSIASLSHGLGELLNFDHSLKGDDQI